MATLPIHRVDSSRSESIEPLGSKRKFWFREGDGRFLFKAEDRGTGEDWAFGTIVPTGTAAWLQRLSEVNFDEIWAILESVPSERMSATCKEFTFALLTTNHRRLLS